MKGLEKWTTMAALASALGACDGDKADDTAGGYPSDTDGAEVADSFIETGAEPGCINVDLAQSGELTDLLATLDEGPGMPYGDCTGELSVNDGEGIPATASELEGSQRWTGVEAPLDAGPNTVCIALGSTTCKQGTYAFILADLGSISVTGATFEGVFAVDFAKLTVK